MKVNLDTHLLNLCMPYTVSGSGARRWLTVSPLMRIDGLISRQFQFHPKCSYLRAERISFSLYP